MGYLLIPLVGVLVTDLPFLLGVVALQWVLTYTHWPLSPWPLLWELVGVLLLEGFLGWLLPAPGMTRVTRHLGMEGIALGMMTLYLGVLPGLAMWQFSLGSDAALGMRKLSQGMVRRFELRLVRLVAGFILIALSLGGVFGSL